MNYLNQKKIINKTNALINLNYNKSLPYMIPDLLKLILYFTNDLSTTKTLYCTSKIFHPLIAKLKTLKYISHYHKNNQIGPYPLLPCFKSARHIMFINFNFNKHIVLEDFSLGSTNNIICDVLLSTQYIEVFFIKCHIEEYIINFLRKNKSIQKLTLDQIDGFSDKYIFSCLMQHKTLTQIIISNTNFNLESVTDDHIDYILYLTNQFNNHHCHYLCQLFKKSKVTHISLIHCGINNAYFLLYMKFLLDANIILINLSNNLITKDYNNLIYQALQKCHKNITIDLTNNPIEIVQINKWRYANPLVQIIF
jgi:hypothetical protein